MKNARSLASRAPFCSWNKSHSLTHSLNPNNHIPACLSRSLSQLLFLWLTIFFIRRRWFFFLFAFCFMFLAISFGVQCAREPPHTNMWIVWTLCEFIDIKKYVYMLKGNILTKTCLYFTYANNKRTNKFLLVSPQICYQRSNHICTTVFTLYKCVSWVNVFVHSKKKNWLKRERERKNVENI